MLYLLLDALYIVFVFLLGHAILRCLRIELQSFAIYSLVAIGIGIGTVLQVLLMLALSGFLTYTYCIALFLIPLPWLIFQSRFLRDHFTGQLSIKALFFEFPPELRHPLFFSIICLSLAYSAVLFIHASTPIVNADALGAYMLVAKFWTKHASVVHVPGAVVNGFAPNNYLLNAMGMILHDDIFSLHLSGFVFFVLTLITLFVLADLWFGKAIALISISIAACDTNFITTVQSGSAWAGVAFFALMGVLCFTLWLSRWDHLGNRLFLILSGLFVGFAVGFAFYNLYLSTFLLLAILICYTCKERRISAKALSSCLWFAGASLITVLPWCAHNESVYGNPVFPFFSSYFQDGVTCIAETPRWHVPAHLLRESGDMNFPKFYEWAVERGKAVVGAVLNIRSQGYMFPLVLGFLPFSLVWWRTFSKKQRKIGVFFLLAFICASLFNIFSLAFLASITNHSLITRYFMAVVYLGLVLAAGILYNYLSSGRWIEKVAIFLFVIVGQLAAFGVNFMEACYFHKIPVALGRIDRVDFLRGSIHKNLDLPSYAFAEYIQSHLQVDEKLLIGSYNNSYYFNRACLYPSDMYGTHIKEFKSADDLLRFLKKERITHYFTLTRSDSPSLSSSNFLFNTGFRSDYMDKVYEGPNYTLYRFQFDAL